MVSLPFNVTGFFSSNSAAKEWCAAAGTAQSNAMPANASASSFVIADLHRADLTTGHGVRGGSYKKDFRYGVVPASTAEPSSIAAGSYVTDAVSLGGGILCATGAIC